MSFPSPRVCPFSRDTLLQQAGTYTVWANFDPDTAAADIKEIIRRIPIVSSGDPWYRSAFETARRRAILAVGARSSAQWASWITFSWSAGRDVKWVADIGKRYAALTYDDVARLATAELSPDKATWIISGPHDAVANVYAELGVEPIWMTH